MLNATSFAQQVDPAADIQGDIISPSGTDLKDFSVELREARGDRRRIGNASITSGSQFSFLQVPSSVYVVRVKNQAGDVIAEQVVNPSEHPSRVQVRLAEKRQPLQDSNLVSVADLSHKLSDKAIQEARKADKALAKNDLTGMIGHLEKVMKIDPQYIAARRNLSLGYLKTFQFEKAIDSFQKLAELDPHSPLPYSGLSVIYYDLHRLVDSETAARRVLEIDSSYELGHFLLGTTLAAQNKDHQQALRHLAQAMRRFPGAHLTAAGILARQGHREDAKVQLLAYFDSGDATFLSDAEDLLSQLY